MPSVELEHCNSTGAERRAYFIDFFLNITAERFFVKSDKMRCLSCCRKGPLKKPRVGILKWAGVLSGCVGRRCVGKFKGSEVLRSGDCRLWALELGERWRRCDALTSLESPDRDGQAQGGGGKGPLTASISFCKCSTSALAPRSSCSNCLIFSFGYGPAAPDADPLASASLRYLMCACNTTDGPMYSVFPANVARVLC